jgi:hypothetical protein
VRFAVKKETAIAFAKETPAAASEVAILGYAYGARELAMQFGRVALPADVDGNLLLDVTTIRGDSGGAAIDLSGELVGMTSAIKQSGGYLAVLKPVEQARDFVKEYLPKKLTTTP